MDIDTTPAPRRVSGTAVATALGTIGLIVPEIWLAAFGLLWGLHVIGHLSFAADAILAVALGVPALWATWHVVRLAFEAERDAGSAL